jgi:hypothetical protein
VSTAISLETAFGDVVDVIRAAVDLGARKRSGRRSTAENRLIKRAERRPPLDDAARPCR